MKQLNNIISKIEQVPVLQKAPRITPSFSTYQLSFHNGVSQRSLLGRGRDIESCHGHSLQFFVPWSTLVNDSLSGASSSYSAAGSSVNAESSSGSFNVLVSSTMLYFGWPIAASVPTSRGISFVLG
jgi:hypothetical protein